MYSREVFMEWDARFYRDNSEMQYHAGLDLLEQLHLLGNESVIDIGCGDGKLTIQLAKLVPRGSVLAIDSSEEMIEQARITARSYGIKNINCRCMNAIDIHFINTFDAIYSNCVLNWIASHKLLYKKMHDALKPGGRLAISMTQGVPAALATIEFTAQIHLVQEEKYTEYFARLLDKPGLIFPFREGSKKSLEKASFTNISVETRSIAHGFENLAAYIRSMQSTRWVPILSCFPDELKPEIVARFTTLMENEWNCLTPEQQADALETKWPVLFILAGK